MLVVKSFHIIAMVAWFAGLFYLPRLFVYHTQSTDKLSIDRFQIMESRLYYAIMFPAAIITTVLGIWLITYNPNYYLHAKWLHAKVILVLLLWAYHVYCGYCVRQFTMKCNNHSTKFYRILNELPTLLLIMIVLLVVTKPF